MAITTAHPSYTHASAKWQRVRDAVSGADAVHGAGERYLPRLGGQSPAEYKAYAMRAGWFGATSRTIDALHGLIFRKPAEITAPQELLDDVTMSGRSAVDFASDVAREVLGVGRVGVLVDHVAATQGPSNAAQAAAMGLRPYLSMYTAERIVNWRTARINGRTQLALVVLSEDYEVAGADEFEITTATQYRVLRLLDGVYVQQVWRESAGSSWSLVEQSVPMQRGAAMTSIPFVLIGPEHLGADVSDPPLIDLADVNLSHYRTGADLEHGAHFTGLPTPVIAGYQKQDPNEVLSIGSTSAWVFSDPAAHASYLEFTGSGLSTLEKLMDRKESQMAQLGARMLTDQKAGVESANALEIRSSGETSMLGALAQTVSHGLTRALTIASTWMGGGVATVSLNTAFSTGSLDPAKLQALVGAWQAGAISHKTLFWNLQQGELVADDVAHEDEQAIIADEGPKLLGALPAASAGAA